MILLSSTSFKEKDVFKKIENLQIHLFKPEHEDRAIKEVNNNKLKVIKNFLKKRGAGFLV